MWQVGRCCYQRSQWVRPPDYNLTPGKITYLTSILVQNSIKLCEKKFCEKNPTIFTFVVNKWIIYIPLLLPNGTVMRIGTLCTVNDVIGKDPLEWSLCKCSVRAFHLKKTLKFPFTSLMVHSVGADSKIENIVFIHLPTKSQIWVYFLLSHIVFWFQEAFKTNWISWFNDSLMTPQSLCFSTQNDLLLIGTCSGILTVIPTKLILSGESATTVQHGSKKVRVVKAKDEAEIGRRAMPVSISWWATNESKALAIVGTNHGLVIIIDLVDGKEVSFFTKYAFNM